MRTVRVNKKATVVLLIGSLIFGSLLLSQLPKFVDDELPPLGHKVLLARDIKARAQVFAEADRAESNESKVDILKLEIAENVVQQQFDVIDDVQTNVDNGTVSGEDGVRLAFVRQMMKHAWEGYKKYAWGENEVQPISKQPYNQGIFGGATSSLAATIVDAVDTLWIMGLKEEYAEARDYIRDKFDLMTAPGSISVFETNIRFLGGILSAFALTNETFYIEKARSVGDILLKAFDSRTGIPKSTLNVKTGSSSNYGWANGGSSVLSEIGSLHLEFAYLSLVTQNPIYREKVQSIRDHLDRLEKPEGLYFNYISPITGQWTSKHASLGAMGDSFYEYLIKAYVLSGKTDQQAWRMYTEAVDTVERMLVQKSKGGLTYVAEWRNGGLEHKMGHLACFCVGMFAMQADLESDVDKKQRIMDLAEELGHTCHESYRRTPTGIGPEMFYFVENNEAMTTVGDHGYILRPEVIEGFFYLWRLTGKPIYKEWVWNATMSIEKYCKHEAGYAGLRNVYDPGEGSDNVQQSFFLAETLKYAFLTFADNSVISLDSWVFNTEAHPLPVIRQSDDQNEV